MKFGNVLASTAVAISVIASPVAAQAATNADELRVGSEAEGEQLAGGLLLPILAAIALGVVIWLVVDDNNDDLPTSP